MFGIFKKQETSTQTRYFRESIPTYYGLCGAEVSYATLTVYVVDSCGASLSDNFLGMIEITKEEYEAHYGKD